MSIRLTDYIKTKGYSGIYKAIDNVIDDLIALDYDREEIEEIIKRFFISEDYKINQYINLKLKEDDYEKDLLQKDESGS